MLINKGADMKYYTEPMDDFFSVSQEGMDEFYVGYIRPLKDTASGLNYLVSNAWNCGIAFVKSFDEAIPALAAHYEEDPPWWHGRNWRRSQRHIRETPRGQLCVYEIKPGKWCASRKGNELLINGKRAIFATCEEAQHAADAHLRADEVEDNGGFSWASP